jgi:hypothetical protein
MAGDRGGVKVYPADAAGLKAPRAQKERAAEAALSPTEPLAFDQKVRARPDMRVQPELLLALTEAADVEVSWYTP